MINPAKISHASTRNITSSYTRRSPCVSVSGIVRTRFPRVYLYDWLRNENVQKRLYGFAQERLVQTKGTLENRGRALCGKSDVEESATGWVEG